MALGDHPLMRAHHDEARSKQLYETDEFRIYCFKILPCTRKHPHDWSACPFAHPTEKIKRRDPRIHVYDCNMCPHVVKGEECSHGSSCPHSHNAFESWLHPQKYRTLLCKDQQGCKRQICFFAHGREQLRTPSDPPRTSEDAAGQHFTATGTLMCSSSSRPDPYLQTAGAPALPGNQSPDLYSSGSGSGEAGQMQLPGMGADATYPGCLLRLGSSGSGSYSSPIGSLHNSSSNLVPQGASPPVNSSGHLANSGHSHLQAGRFNLPPASSSGLGMPAGGMGGSAVSASTTGPYLASVVEMPELPQVHVISPSSNFPASQAVPTSSSGNYSRSCPLPVIGPDGRCVFKFSSLPSATSDEQLLTRLMEQVQLAWQESAPGSDLRLLADAAMMQQLQASRAVPAACQFQGYSPAGTAGTLAAAVAGGTQPYVVYAVPASNPAGVGGHSSSPQSQLQTGPEAVSFGSAQGAGQQQMILQLSNSSQQVPGQLQLVQQPMMTAPAAGGNYVVDSGLQLSQAAGPSASPGHVAQFSSCTSQILQVPSGGSQFAGASLPVSQGLMPGQQVYGTTGGMQLGMASHLTMQPQLYSGSPDTASVSLSGGQVAVSSGTINVASGELVWKPSNLSASGSPVQQAVGQYVPLGSGAPDGATVVQPVGWVVPSQPAALVNMGWKLHGN